MCNCVQQIACYSPRHTLTCVRSAGDAHALTWLPKELPKHVRIIVSTLEGKCLDALRSSEVTLPEVAVDPLDVSTRKEIISQILAEYNKILDKNQVTAFILHIKKCVRACVRACVYKHTRK